MIGHSGGHTTGNTQTETHTHSKPALNTHPQSGLSNSIFVFGITREDRLALITARPLRRLFALGLPEVRVLAVEGLARMLLAARATSARAARGTWADRDDAVRALRTRGAVPRGLLVADDAAQRSCLLIMMPCCTLNLLSCISGWEASGVGSWESRPSSSAASAAAQARAHGDCASAGRPASPSPP